MTLTRVAIALCQPCLTAKGSRMCETPACSFFHEVLPSTFTARITGHPVVDLDVLTRVWEYLDERQDVRAGWDGQPVPNTAMQLARDVEEALDALPKMPVPEETPEAMAERLRLADFLAREKP